MSKDVSRYLTFLLRHHPEDAALDMDIHGWVDVEQLIAGVNTHSRYRLDKEALEYIVASDAKGRYRLNDAHTRIKCCQGHSIPWVVPELTYDTPPDVLYHGTTEEAWEKIQADGMIRKMGRHAVHMQPTAEQAWQSAERWKQVPLLLKIDAKQMCADGCQIGMADNAVWCTEEVPTRYVCGVIRK